MTRTPIIKLDELTLDPRLQPRARLDEQLVQEYADAMRRGDVFPPLRVIINATDAWLVDGWHRVGAARQLGLAELPVQLKRGTFEEAEDASFTVNRDHGLRRTHADVQNAIRRALLTPRWVERSDNWIAKHIGCSDKTVSGQREHLETTSEIPNLDKLIGEDGKARPRKRTAAAPLIIQDTYSLGEWAALSEKDQKRVLAATAEAGGTFNKQSTDSIEWARWSWNPVTGCKHNCPYCYARDIATRFQFAHGFEPALYPKRLGAPARVLPPAEAAEQIGLRNVFTCSMADLFGRWVPEAWIRAVLASVAAAPAWNFLFLTKFPSRLIEFEFPANAWIGTTVDCQARVDAAERAFAGVRASVKWLSCEPLLEPLQFSNLSLFQWVVIGGASRSEQTPEWWPPRQWSDDLRAAAWAAGCQVYEKTNLLRRWRQYPGDNDTPALEAPSEFAYLKVKSRDEIELGER